MILLTYWAGMRVGEVASLKVSDVMNIDGSLKKEIRLSANQTKGSKGRVVLLPSRLLDELGIYLNQEKYKTREDSLFRSQKGNKGFSPDSLTHIFKKLYIRAGLENGSSHSGRRTFITSLASKGVSARVLQELAGHKHLSTTQRYIDINDEMMRRAIELI
jgi:integrase/recombinase XerD